MELGLNCRVCVFLAWLLLWSTSTFAVNPSADNKQDVCTAIKKTYAEQNNIPTAVEKALYSYPVELRMTAVKCLADTGDSGVIKPLADLFVQERFSSPVKPEIISAIVKLKGTPAKLVLMVLLKGELDAVYPVQQNLPPHVLAEEFQLIQGIMAGLEDYGDKDVADFLLSLSRNADEKWIDVICEAAYKSYLAVNAKLNNKTDIKDKVDFIANDIQGGNPSVKDYVQGKSGIKKFASVQEYGARTALVSLGFKALPETWELTKSLPASKKREALAILIASILANNIDNNTQNVDKLAVLTWLLNEYKSLSKEEKFGSHFYLLQNLSLIKLKSQDAQIQKILSEEIDEKKFKPVDLDALKKKADEEQKAYLRKKLESKPPEIRSILNRMDKIKKASSKEEVSFIVDQLANKDKDVVRKAMEILHGLVKSGDHRTLVWPYAEKIMSLTDSMDNEFLIDIAKVFTWLEKPGMEKEFIHVLKDKNAQVNKKIVALLVLGHIHNIESLKLVLALRASASGKLRSAADVYLDQFDVDTWMKSDSEIDEQVNRILKPKQR